MKLASGKMVCGANGGKGRNGLYGKFRHGLTPSAIVSAHNWKVNQPHERFNRAVASASRRTGSKSCGLHALYYQFFIELCTFHICEDLLLQEGFKATTARL